MGKARNPKQEREQLACALRAAGASWVEVAETLSRHYRVNARLAFRYAHGWSQSRAAEEWNRRWPDELKSFKNFSYWESWPGNTGHAPSYDNLCKLAELYQCAASDLLVDLPDFRHLDTACSGSLRADKPVLALPGGCKLDDDAEVSTQDDGSSWDAWSPFVLASGTTPFVQRLQEVDFTELAQVIVMWMQKLNPSASRRELLSKLSAAFAAASVLPLFDMLNPEEYERVARVVNDPDKFDLAALAYVESMTINLRRQDNVLGPQLTTQSAIGHRQLAQQLAQAAPAEFQQRAVSAYADLTQFLGWLCFSMCDYPSAQHYYEDARSAAHDAQNVELVTYILCTMSQLATGQGKPRVGIDHAVAAAVWAEQANSPLAQAYAADVAVRAYVADNQPEKFQETLDQEYAALQAARTGEPTATWWYFYDESFYWSTEGKCALKLQRPEAALSAMDQSLARADPANLHERIFRLLLRAEARIQQVEIQEASSILADAVRLTAARPAQRIAQRVTEVRGLLRPWERTKPVRELDEQLAAYRPAAGSGSGNTKRTYSL